MDLFVEDVHRFLVDRVVPHATTRPQAVDEPLCIERRHVRRSTGGDDDGAEASTISPDCIFMGSFSGMVGVMINDGVE